MSGKNGFSFLKAYIVLHGVITEATFDDIETITGSLFNSAMGPAHTVNSSRLFYILATSTRGTANLLTRQAGSGEGYLAWRKLHDRYASTTQGKQFAMLQAILRPEPWPADSASFESSLLPGNF